MGMVTWPWGQRHSSGPSPWPGRRVFGGQRVPGAGAQPGMQDVPPGTPTPARALPWAEGPAGGAGTAGRAAPSRGQPAAERRRAGGAVQAVQHAEPPPPPSADPPATIPLAPRRAGPLPSRRGTESARAAPRWLGTRGCLPGNNQPRYPRQPHPVTAATASPHLAAVHVLQLRGAVPPRGPGARGGAARAGLRLRDPAGHRGAGWGPPRRHRGHRHQRKPKEKTPPMKNEPLGTGRCDTPGGQRRGRAAARGGRCEAGRLGDSMGTAPRPGGAGDVTRSGRLGLLDPGIAPGSQRCGEKSRGLSTARGGNRGDGKGGSAVTREESR